MSQIEIQVKGLFATPVAAVILPDADARNAELQEIILRRRAEQPSIGASNMGGWHSTRDFAEWGGKRAEEILTFGRDLATKLTADREGRAVRPEWKTEAWANVADMATRMPATIIRVRSGPGPIMSATAAAPTIRRWAGSSRCSILAGRPR